VEDPVAIACETGAKRVRLFLVPSSKGVGAEGGISGHISLFGAFPIFSRMLHMECTISDACSDFKPE
jgi:hypothetical protein